MKSKKKDASSNFFVDRRYFCELFETKEFVDRFQSSDLTFDIIIPVLNTDVFFYRNLLSIYREIPVHRLLIGDAGCTDNTLAIAALFPRVSIFDHKEFHCQGASIKALIEEVETDVFAYCHADVFLPSGFFDGLSSYDFQNKWVESSRNRLIIREEFAERCFSSRRSYSGVQIGDSALLKSSVRNLQDDYIQRNEDIVIRDLVEQSGGTYEKTLSLMHLHQSPVARGFGKPAYSDEEWAARIYNMQVKGIVKYLPVPADKDREYLLHLVWQSIFQLLKRGVFDYREFMSWVKDNNPSWVPVLTKRKLVYARCRRAFPEIIRRLKCAIRVIFTGQ